MSDLDAVGYHQCNRTLSRILGVALGLCLQTSWRRDIGIGVPIGIGEAALAVTILVTLAYSVIDQGRVNGGREPWSLIVAMLCLVGVPAVTLFNLSFSTISGGSLRDAGIYCLAGLLLLSLRCIDLDIPALVVAAVCVIVGSIILNEVFGNSNWYFQVRFAAGSTNPNQLAIYALSLIAILILAGTFPYRQLYATFLVGCGVLSGSDAFGLSLAAMAGVAIAAQIASGARMSDYTPLLVGAVLWMAMTVIKVDMIDFTTGNVAVLRASIDEGGGRLSLWYFGIVAWLKSSGSVLVGHGAGSYSGFTAPFQGVEAHNTIIDLLTIGGVVFLIPYLMPLFRAVVQLRRSHIVVAAVGLLTFSQFHFVGRQPVFWLAWFVLAHGQIAAGRDYHYWFKSLWRRNG